MMLLFFYLNLLKVNNTSRKTIKKYVCLCGTEISHKPLDHMSFLNTEKFYICMLGIFLFIGGVTPPFQSQDMKFPPPRKKYPLPKKYFKKLFYKVREVGSNSNQLYDF